MCLAKQILVLSQLGVKPESYNTLMANHEMLEVWPLSWRDTKSVAKGVIGQLQNKGSVEDLTTDDLQVLNSTLEHLEYVWAESDVTPIIRNGVGVIRAHFARKFQIDTSLPPDDQYRLILDKTLPTGHFEGTPGEDPELKAIVKLACYEMAEARARESFTLY